MWLALHLPWLPLEIYARGWPLSSPLAVTEGQGTQCRILQCNNAAAKAGIRPDMELGAALALAPEIHCNPRQHNAEQHALRQLATWAYQFTSAVSIADTQTVLLEISGSLTLFGGLQRLCDRIAEQVPELGYHCLIATTPTPRAALWFARAHQPLRIACRDVLADHLSRLSVHILQLPQDDTQALLRLGAYTLGDCLKLPRAGLNKRFGSALLESLDKALGRQADPQTPFIPPARFEARLLLPTEVEHSEALLFAARRLLNEFSGFLRFRQLGARQFTLALIHRHHASTLLPVGLVSAKRDPVHLFNLLRERMQNLILTQPVIEIGLYADQLQRVDGQSSHLFEKHHSHEASTDLIERLRARLGDDAVHGVEVIAEHRPERAWRYGKPVAQTQQHNATKTRPPPAPNAAPASRRPLWLLPHPLPLRCLDKQPYFDGPLTLSSGPERIESGWWDGNDVKRDYYIARNPAGECLWVFREHAPGMCWFLHGLFG